MRRSFVPLLGACLLALGAAGGWYLFAEPVSSARETAGARARSVPVEVALAETAAPPPWFAPPARCSPAMRSWSSRRSPGG
ncbi:MAG: hypothetical protein U1E52_08375 [Geminicoccaceae bacterium]